MDKDSYSVHHHHGSGAAGVGVFTPAGSGNMLERGEIVKMSAAGMSASPHGVGAGAPGVAQGDMTLRHMPHVPYSTNGLLGPNDGATQGGVAALHHGKSILLCSPIKYLFGRFILKICKVILNYANYLSNGFFVFHALKVKSKKGLRR